MTTPTRGKGGRFLARTGKHGLGDERCGRKGKDSHGRAVTCAKAKGHSGVHMSGGAYPRTFRTGS